VKDSSPKYAYHSRRLDLPRSAELAPDDVERIIRYAPLLPKIHLAGLRRNLVSTASKPGVRYREAPANRGQHPG
jgi:hypothetical protein